MPAVPAMVHLYFNIIGVTVFLAGFYGLNAVVHFDFVNETIAAWGIAVVHSAFNIAATLILLPFANGLEKLDHPHHPRRRRKRELCSAG